MAFKMRGQKQAGIFNAVYLTGAHNLIHDVSAVCMLKQSLKMFEIIVRKPQDKVGMAGTYFSDYLYKLLKQKIVERGGLQAGTFGQAAVLENSQR